MATSDLHPKRVQAQHTVRIKEQDLKFTLFEGSLIIQINGDVNGEPITIDAQATLAVLNMMWANKDEVIAAARCQQRGAERNSGAKRYP